MAGGIVFPGGAAGTDQNGFRESLCGRGGRVAAGFQLVGHFSVRQLQPENDKGMLSGDGKQGGIIRSVQQHRPGSIQIEVIVKTRGFGG